MSKTEQELENKFGVPFYSRDLVKRYNIAPYQIAAVLVNQEGYRWEQFTWGFIPFWAKKPTEGLKMINARSETVFEKPAFKSAFKQQRCIVPADGYYEWVKSGKEKLPYRICRADEGLFAMAGLYSQWQQPNGDTWRTFTVITAVAHRSISHIHNRMPVILSPFNVGKWLDTNAGEESLLNCLSNESGEALKFYRVSKEVNNARFDHPRAFEKVDDRPPKTLFDL